LKFVNNIQLVTKKPKKKDLIERIRNALINQEDDVRGDNDELEDDDEEQEGDDEKQEGNDEEQDMAWLIQC